MTASLFTEALAVPAAGEVLVRVAQASVAGGLLALAVWGLLRVAPGLPAGWRCALWWAVSLKLVLALIWVAPLELPILPATTGGGETPAVALAGPEPGGSVADPVSAGGPTAEAASVSPALQPYAGAVQDLPWRPALALFWLLGVAAGAAGIGRELIATRRLVRGSRPASDPGLLAAFQGLRERLGIRGRVALRLSETAGSPLTTGLVRPAVVLPARVREDLSPEELELALAHELLHVRRRDLWTGWVPVLAHRLFFFHPLAALAAREYRLAREAACDAAVVRELGAAPRVYGRLLLRWSRSPDPRTILAAGAASPSFLDLKRRLAMLQNPFALSRGLKLLAWSAALLAAVALVPVRIVAATPAPPAPPAAPEAPETPEPPEPPAPPARVAALAPEAPEAPRAPEPPEPPEPPKTGYAYGWTGDDEAWALVEGDSHVWMSGDYRQMRRARRYQSETGEPLLWIERDGREYVIRDPETVERAQEILEPSRELGRRQGELGARQGELGAEQGELGARQGELGAQQGELGARQAGLAAEQAALAAERAALAARRASDGSGAQDRARRVKLDAEMKELSRRMRELGERQRELGERQRELSEPQAELGRRQAELGAQQAALGEKQRAASETARVEIRELIDRAIEQGLAEPVSPDR